MPVRKSSTSRQLRLGSELRKLREAAGTSSTEAGRLLGTSQAQISNIETGRVGVSGDRVRAMASNYHCTDEALVEALVVMAGERRRGWWDHYQDLLPVSLLDLAEAEHHAAALRVTQVITVPGLLQTPEHARAIFREFVPTLKPHEVEHRVSHRIKRQEVLFREDPPSYTAIIHEAALRMQFGGPETAAAQLAHLVAMSEHPHITLAVIPFDGTSFPVSGHGVDYLYGPVPQLDTVQLDTGHGGDTLDAAPQLERYRLMLDRMQDIALAPAPSRDLISRIAHAL
ncbi:DNA-binding protein [Streptomyces eurocidicus]|uniref:DNA-binding protein n=1 Tax=Streptomyces eurocidicus TaxID=66423 RepID=A0A2N8P2P5_STREU|nr:helix-turn-helix transcriptional regulator [Streptomyces eurocidicus]MBB5117429.1 transcriptional regulator with XRE-family HTH domain [Streptomyces eurocidicus]MBF6053273.1 helix-turn-helix domain-containing protein [Streptomyces eurocidicus]PNE35284.1 DNA-binding protein [Streptomyces eurocidicus]